MKRAYIWVTLLTFILPLKCWANANDWQKRWWIEKAARALRGGEGLAANEDVTQYLDLSREQVVEKFMQDPRFGNTVLDFNMAYLGFKNDRVQDNRGEYTFKVYQLPQAIHSAQAVMANGDFLTFFDLVQPFYMAPLENPVESGPSTGNETPDEIRQKHFNASQAQLDALIAEASAIPAPPLKQLCDEFNSYFNSGITDNLGLPPNLEILRKSDLNWFLGPQFICFLGGGSAADLLKSLQTIKSKNEEMYAEIQDFRSQVYSTPSVLAIKDLNLGPLNLSRANTMFTQILPATTLTNSSTNFDRKRAAYVLKRFFCDDLNPINVENPGFHAGQHGTDPACFSCHYKLDPMAGYFRNYGILFYDFSKRGKIIFDDQAQADVKDYVSHWKADPKTGRQWDVGYIRSTSDDSLNDYGDTLEDLFALLKRAPEVKRCLVQRMFEYFVSDTQTVDGDFLDYLTEQFTEAAKINSSGAFKKTVAAIVLSNSFSNRHLDSTQCYDHRPGAPITNSAPCRVASILEKNCVHCHGNTEKKPFLDLHHWSAGIGFPHLDGPKGQQISLNKTYQQILDRISNTDPDQRMPYMREMPSTERQELYKWVDSQLSGRTP